MEHSTSQILEKEGLWCERGTRVRDDVDNPFLFNEGSEDGGCEGLALDRYRYT